MDRHKGCPGCNKEPGCEDCDIWEELQRLRHHLARIHHLVQYRMLPEEDTFDRIYPRHSDDEIIDMVDKEVSRIRGTEDA